MSQTLLRSLPSSSWWPFIEQLVCKGIAFENEEFEKVCMHTNDTHENSSINKHRKFIGEYFQIKNSYGKRKITENNAPPKKTSSLCAHTH